MNRCIYILLALCPFFANAQTGDIKQDTINWTATSDINLSTNESFTRTSTFVSYGSSKIDFVNGTKARSFTVTSVEGDWADISQPGQVIYQVLFRDLPGTITISRTEKGLTLTLDLSQSSADGIRNQYIIDHYTAQ